MSTPSCPICGQPVRYKLAPPSGPSWDGLLESWLAQYGTRPVPAATLMALWVEHGGSSPGPLASVYLGHMLAEFSKAGQGPPGYTVIQHSKPKGVRKPSTWKLVPKGEAMIYRLGRQTFTTQGSPCSSTGSTHGDRNK